MNKNMLLSGDADAIKEYVFETSYLPQIRGGSQLLIKCEEEVERLVAKSGGEKIYCGGGSFLFLAPREKARYLKDKIEQIYIDNTGVATVTVTFEGETVSLKDPGPIDGWAARLWQASGEEGDPAAGNDLEKGFAFRASLIAADLREEKTQRTIVPFQEALPIAKRCECCGKRMASEKIQRSPRGEVVEFLRACGICHMKHQKAGKGDHGTRGKFNEKFYDFMLNSDPHFAASPAKDLEEITRGMRREHLAFIYADGNEIGNLLGKGKSKKEYMAISKGLLEGTESALIEALHKVCGQILRDGGEKKSIWPFEIISVGGDDVTVLAQAGYAWELAIEFLENFEMMVMAIIKEELGGWPEGWPEVTASCGIAIADTKYPMRYLQRLAEGSLKKAKKKAKEDPQNPKSAIDFIWLPNPVLSESIETLAGYYHRNDRFMTARPYSLNEARTLNGLAKRATKLPRSQRHLWQEALEKGIHASRNVILYNIARMKEDKRIEFENFLTDVTNLAAPQALESIWVERTYGKTRQHCTALLDVLELAELLSMCKDWEQKEEKV